MKKMLIITLIFSLLFTYSTVLADDIQVIGEGNMLPVNESSMNGDIEIKISNAACAEQYGTYYADKYHKVFSFDCLIRNWGFDTLEIMAMSRVSPVSIPRRSRQAHMLSPV